MHRKCVGYTSLCRGTSRAMPANEHSDSIRVQGRDVLEERGGGGWEMGDGSPIVPAKCRPKLLRLKSSRNFGCQPQSFERRGGSRGGGVDGWMDG